MKLAMSNSMQFGKKMEKTYCILRSINITILYCLMKQSKAFDPNKPNFSRAIKESISPNLDNDTIKKWRTFLGWAYLADKFQIFGPLIVSMKDSDAWKNFNFSIKSDMGAAFMKMGRFWIERFEHFLLEKTKIAKPRIRSTCQIVLQLYRQNGNRYF